MRGAETPETSETETACEESSESECEGADETVDITEDIQPAEEPDTTAEESPEAQEPVDENEPMDTVSDTDADEAPAPTEQPTLQDVDELTISLPMSGHTAQSLRNFLNLMYSRGPLLNKAMGTNFTVSQGLLDALEQATPHTVSEMLDELEEYRLGAGTTGMTGIQITAEKISLAFAGPLTQEKVRAYTELCAAMNRMAIAQKRIQAKTVNDANEKYALRIWLIRLGLNGDEHKTIRKLLMQNLSGHAAFRTRGRCRKVPGQGKGKAGCAESRKTGGTRRRFCHRGNGRSGSGSPHTARLWGRRRWRRERKLLTPYGDRRIRESFFHCTDINSENVQYQVYFSP